jgi:hypothetical protein
MSGVIQLLSTFNIPQTITYATWNPSDKSSTITLSSGNLRADHNATSTNNAVRGTIGKASGKPYWEVTAFNVATQQTVGIATASATLNGILGQDINGWGYLNVDGKRYNNGTGVVFGTTWTTTDILGLAFDIGAGTLQIFKNSVSQGTITGIPGGTWFPAWSGNINDVCTANFGQNAFSQTVPSGFSSGWF